MDEQAKQGIESHGTELKTTTMFYGIWQKVKDWQHLCSCILRDSTPRFVSPSIHLSIHLSVCHTSFFYFKSFQIILGHT